MELWMELQWQLRWQLRPPSGTEPKQPNPSRIQAQPVQKSAPEKLPNVAFWRPQEAVQQNAPRYLWNPLESIKTRMQAHRRQKLWISSRIQAKRMPKNSFTSPLEPIKNNKKTMLWYGSETPELVRFRNTRTLAGHAKQNACQKTLSRHLWNP